MKRRYLGLLLLITLVEAFLGFGNLYTDTGGFVLARDHFFSGLPLDFNEARRITMFPVLFVSLFLTPIFGSLSLAASNTLFWLLAVVVTYYFFGRFMNDFKSFLATLLFTTSLPLLNYGSAMLVESATYFAVILFLYTYNFEKDPRKLGLVNLFAIFSKMSLAVLAAYALTKAFIEKRLNKELVVALISPVLLYFVVISLAGWSLGDWFSRAATGPGATAIDPQSRIFYFVRSFFTAFTLLPLFALPMLREKGWERLFLFVAAITLFIWPVQTGRYTFIVFPAIISLSMRFFDRLPENLKYLMILIQVGVNNIYYLAR